MGLSIIHPALPDPVLIAQSRPHGSIAPMVDSPAPVNRPDDKPSDTGLDLAGLAIGAALVYGAVSSSSEYSDT